MFRIAKSKQRKTDFPVIADNYRTLLFNDLPILFTGTNRFTNTIIGSSVDEDYQNGVERFFHIIVDIEDYFSFLRRKATYRSLLEKAGSIYVVDKHVRTDERTLYEIDFASIPDAYKPGEQSFCPKIATTPSCSYAVSLEGGLADLNSAYPEQLGKTQNKVAQLLSSAFSSLKKAIHIEPVVLQRPATTGSFTINFNVEIKEERPSLFTSTQDTDYFGYLNEYLAYCLNDLPADVDSLLDHRFGGLEAFNSLLGLHTAFRSALRREEPDIREQEAFAQDVLKAPPILYELANDLGNSYTRIAIMNDPQQDRNVLGIVGPGNQKTIQETLSVIEQKTAREFDVDSVAKNYDIYIYDLNTDTRSGHAHAKHPNPKKIAKPRIKISGTGSLAETKYTESLYRNEYVEVLGKATKVDNVITSLEIEFEESV